MLSLSKNVTRLSITAVAVAMSVFHLYVAFVGPPDAYVMRGAHLAFALVLAYLILPGLTGKAETQNRFTVFKLPDTIDAAGGIIRGGEAVRSRRCRSNSRPRVRVRRDRPAVPCCRSGTWPACPSSSTRIRACASAAVR